jgi:threonine/homoserine/homoserine lactone efflux protein
MIESSQFYFFLGATLALLLVPGPAVLYIVARSINQGRLAGLISVLGVETANLLHVVGASLGLSAILLSSAIAFNAVKYAGAAYLIYLGIRKLIGNESKQQNEEIKQDRLWRIYAQGFVVNLLNPKTALFFFAFLPQFINPTGNNPATQFFFLGVIFVALAIITDAGYAFLASSVANKLKGNRRFSKGQRYVTGCVYIGLGVSTAISGGSKK